METLYKSKWLVFGFFRLVVDYLNKITVKYDSYEAKIQKLEEDKITQLRLTAELTDVVNNLNEQLVNLQSMVMNFQSLSPTHASASDLIKHPSLLMDKIKNDYEERANKRTEGTE